MKTQNYIDLGTIFDELFNAASEFRSEFQKSLNEFSGRPGYGPGGFRRGPFGFCFDENTDYYPGFSYPPMNVYLTEDKSLNFEFALAGFDEKNISLSFQGDYMVFSAKIGDDGRESAGQEGGAAGEEPNLRYLKRRLKLKDIDKQKYFVPLDKYAQEQVKAVFKNGILRVTVPPKEEQNQNGGVRIDIIKEGN
ncbi:MAG: Hsp20 family protein [Treponema sp.]|jgi:HSP20 family molecular chaperone IbpA|nr:Hsp20 family protein [Treponema sp.]